MQHQQRITNVREESSQVTIENVKVQNVIIYQLPLIVRADSHYPMVDTEILRDGLTNHKTCSIQTNLHKRQLQQHVGEWTKWDEQRRE